MSRIAGFTSVGHFALVGATLLLTACAAQPLAPAAPVPQPAPETAAMQARIAAQLPTLQWMVCLSAAAYSIEKDPLDGSRYVYNAGDDVYRGTCRDWTQAPGTTIQAFPIALADSFGRPYESVYMVWTDDLRKRQVVAMRGTDDLQDWAANLHFRPTPDEILKVSVHEGFSRYAKAVYASLTKDHRGTLKRGYDTYFTGHSLGGAVAVLVGLYFYAEDPFGYSFKGTYTFGQPRVFDTRGTTSWPAYAQHLYRVENCYDPVPLVPIGDSLLHSVLLGPLSADDQRRQYQHLGQEILLLNHGTYWMSGENEVVRNLVSDLQVIFQNLQGDYQNDHYIGTYISRIWTLAAKPPTPVNPAYDFAGKCLPYRLDVDAKTAAAIKRAPRQL